LTIVSRQIAASKSASRALLQLQSIGCRKGCTRNTLRRLRQRGRVSDYSTARPRWDTSVKDQYTGSSVWNVQSGKSIRKDIDHPCPFDEQIVEGLLSRATRAGDLVLDPFAGSGTTLLVAERLNCRFMGFDISDKYRNIWINRRAAQRSRCSSSSQVQ